jgi:hypothetical protein
MPPKKFRLHGKETAKVFPEAQPRPANTPHGEMMGDQRVFTDELRALDNSGQPTGPVVGEHSGHCTWCGRDRATSGSTSALPPTA